MSDPASPAMDAKPPEPGFCERCFERPRDLDGHEALHVFDGAEIAPPRGAVLFRCAFCRAIWARGYAGGGQFEWLLAKVDRSSPRDHG